MCHTPDNSLSANKQRIEEMFLAGTLTKPEMVTRIAAAENSERAYRALMDETDWTQDELLLITGYRLIIIPQ